MWKEIVVILFVLLVLCIFAFWLYKRIQKDKKQYRSDYSWSVADALDRIFSKPIDLRPKLPSGYNARGWLDRSSYR